ncbi:MAG: tRNA1(Val) (adenine(37)-N6)-methyltransferase [Lachnospiraceae bacterium]|nr:tRNA1(Val) (adenine(37)-N6)-methyltransferase [Lachnospiraceae bacterium]
MELRENERIDDLQCGGYRILQNTKKFCFGMDAVLLSDFAKVRPGARVLDLGTGTGVIPILMAAKTQAGHFTGLEIQAEMAKMARRSVALNGLEQKIDIVEADLKEASKQFGGASFDVVTCNPPYMENCHGLKNPEDAKAIARHEVLCRLEDIVRESSAVLKSGGHFYMVYRPRRLAEAIRLMTGYRIEPKRMRLVHPYAQSEANMVLIEGSRGGGRQLRVERPLIVYREPGVYTEEIYEIYAWKQETKESGRRPKS